jgi:transposase
MSKQQIHKRLSDDQVKAILNKYTNKEISAKEARQYLEVSKSRFYQMFNEYEEDTSNFSVKYERTLPTRTLDPAIEKNILKELKLEKEKIIDDPQVPTKHYNYSYIKQLLNRKYQQDAALSTIISRAKDHGYWKAKPPKKIHDREVLTNFIGELIQHDSSYHLWAPDSGQKWYLITSLDDHSRVLLYADFWLRETTWYHILALSSVFLKYGLPFAYDADQHSIFRYVKDRDKQSPWTTYQKFTDDVDPQWQQVLNDCQVKYIPALSPQAKGKVERPYQWLQDHVVRTCVREGITNIQGARKVLQYEVKQYNYKRVHSATGEIPMLRFQRAIKEQKSLFRDFVLKPPFQSVKDIFCLRIERRVSAYRKVSLSGLEIQVPGVPPREKVELRLHPDLKTGVTEVRFWFKGHFTGSQRVKTQDLPVVQF